MGIRDSSVKIYIRRCRQGLGKTSRVLQFLPPHGSLTPAGLRERMVPRHRINNFADSTGMDPRVKEVLSLVICLLFTWFPVDAKL